MYVHLHKIPDSAKQVKAVATHLKDLGDISGLEATVLYKITSVTKVISMLRRVYGWSIRKEFRNDHTGKRYARYFRQTA